MKCYDCRPFLQRCKQRGCGSGCLTAVLITAGIVLLLCVFRAPFL